MTVLLMWIALWTHHCPKHFYLNGVHRNGTYVCREHGQVELWDERNGKVPQAPAQEVSGYISCGDKTPYAVDWRTVGCLKQGGSARRRKKGDLHRIVRATWYMVGT